ncbi:MAG: response regulator [Acidimicrobiia bacterium]
MPSILLVADTPWIVNDVLASLADRSYEITHLDDPRQITDRLAADRPDAVLVDLQIGSMGGMAVCREVRATGDDAPPVILLLDRDADSFLAGRSGAVAAVRKPFSSDALRAAINAAVGAGTPA